MSHPAACPGLLRLRKRSEFLRVAASGCKVVTTSLVVQASLQSSSEISQPIRVGFTVTKKCGGAVDRNRIKRRLRAVADELLPQYGKAGRDYVVLGRASTGDVPFETLRRDLRYALKKVSGKLEEKEE